MDQSNEAVSAAPAANEHEMGAGAEMQSATSSETVDLSPTEIAEADKKADAAIETVVEEVRKPVLSLFRVEAIILKIWHKVNEGEHELIEELEKMLGIKH